MRRTFIFLLIFVSGCSLVSEFPEAARQDGPDGGSNAVDTDPGEPLASPLIAWDFESLEQGTFEDVGRFGAYPLTVEGDVELVDGGVFLDGPDYLVSPPVTGFNVGAVETKSFTIAMWIATGALSQGNTLDAGFNARIVNVSEDKLNRNLMIAQWLDGLIIRVRRDASDRDRRNGEPEIRLLGIFEDLAIHHHVLQVSGTELKYYVDGEVRIEDDLGSEISEWVEDYVLTMGDELGDDERYWTGTVYDIRLYDRAFSPAEIQRAYEAGPPR